MKKTEIEFRYYSSISEITKWSINPFEDPENGPFLIERSVRGGWFVSWEKKKTDKLGHYGDWPKEGH